LQDGICVIEKFNLQVGKPVVLIVGNVSGDRIEPLRNDDIGWSDPGGRSSKQYYDET
jgi:hypothetical protein